jgi:flagellar basal body P-ring protein FlgI
VGLIANLPNTGGDPRPSEQRTTLLQEIRTHEIRNADELIASPSTALVMISAWVPPAIQKNERIDLVVKTSEISDAKVLQSGQLLPTRLARIQNVGRNTSSE